MFCNKVLLNAVRPCLRPFDEQLLYSIRFLYHSLPHPHHMTSPLHPASYQSPRQADLMRRLVRENDQIIDPKKTSKLFAFRKMLWGA